jgi:asparagine synthase (glutamine-hydrolysing)
MSVVAAERRSSAPSAVALGRPRSWVVCLGGVAGPSSLAELPMRRILLEAAGDRRGAVVYAASPDDLPDVAARGSRLAIFEGALYDREALQAELGAAADGERLGDAELVLRAWERWGDETPNRLRGLYATALWDAARERTLAIRDRIGWYPLFVAGGAGRRIFSTSPGLLVQHPEVSAEIHRAALAEILCFRFLDVRESYFTRVRRVPPGWALADDERGERLERYWDLRFGRWLDWERDDIPGRFDAIFAQAVERCLGDGPPAIYLSGGLDSVAVAIEATRQQREAGREPPLALSLAFPDDVDEEAIQRGAAERLGMPQVMMPFWEASGHDETLQRVAEVGATYPAPLINLWRPAYLALGAQGVRHGCRAILTGHGGDEWMDSGIDVAADFLRTGNLIDLVRLYRMARRSYRIPARLMLRNVLWRFGARPLLVQAALDAPGGLGQRLVEARKRRYIAESTPSYLAPDPELRAELDRRAERMLPGPRAGSRYRGGRPGLLDSAMVALLQEDNFESSRRIGVPLRLPFYDADVVEMACRVQPRDLYAGGRSKGLLRDRVVPRMPELGFDRQKKLPATSFMQRIVREQTPSAWRKIGGTPALESLGIVHKSNLENQIEALVAGRLPRAYNLAVFSLSLELWARARG